MTIVNDNGEVHSKVMTVYSNKSSKVMCGQAVASCVDNAYYAHGWASVYIFVQTAFLPQTAVAIAASCAIGNCIQWKLLIGQNYSCFEKVVY